MTQAAEEHSWLTKDPMIGEGAPGGAGVFKRYHESLSPATAQSMYDDTSSFPNSADPNEGGGEAMCLSDSDSEEEIEDLGGRTAPIGCRGTVLELQALIASPPRGGYTLGTAAGVGLEARLAREGHDSRRRCIVSQHDATSSQKHYAKDWAVIEPAGSTVTCAVAGCGATRDLSEEESFCPGQRYVARCIRGAEDAETATYFDPINKPDKPEGGVEGAKRFWTTRSSCWTPRAA